MIGLTSAFKFFTFLLMFALVVESSFGLTDFGFCQEKTKEDRLERYIDIVCPLVLSEDKSIARPEDLTLTIPKHYFTVVERCCLHKRLCMRLEEWDYICKSVQQNLEENNSSN